MSSFGGALKMRCRAASSTSHTNRLIHPYRVKCNTAVCSKHVGPLHVRATRWQENDEGVDITRYTTASQRWNGTGRTVWEEWFRVRTFRCSTKRSRSSEISLQGKEGVLRPFSLLVGATRGAGGVSRVSSGGRWQRVCCLCSLLQELIKLWRKQIDLSRTWESEGSSMLQFESGQGENEQNFTHVWASGTDINCDQSIPSLVTPSSVVSPFY